MLLSPLRPATESPLRSPLQARAGGGLRVLDFATLTAAQLQSRFGWTRSGAGTLIDSGGAVRYGAHNLLLNSGVAAGLLANGGTTVADVPGAGPSGGNAIRVRTGAGATFPNVAASTNAMTVGSSAHTAFACRADVASQLAFGLYNADFSNQTASIFSGPGALSGSGPFRVTGLSATEWTVIRVIRSTSPSTSATLNIYPGSSIGDTAVGNDVLVANLQLGFGSVVVDYVPTAGAPVYLMRTPDYTHGVPGLLLEGARTNNGNRTQQFDAWSASALTVDSNVAVSPSGDTDADKLRESSTTAVHFVSNAIGAIAAGTQYVVSCFFKSDGRSAAYIETNAGAVAKFDFSTGVVTDGSYNGASVIRSGVIQRSDGYSFCWATVVCPNAASNLAYIALGTGSYLGNGTSGVLAWGFDCQPGAYPTSYIPNPTTGTMLRVADSTAMTGALFTEYFGSPATGAVLVDFFVPPVIGATLLYPTVWDLRISGGARLSLWVNNSSNVICGGYGTPVGSEHSIKTGVTAGERIKAIVWWTPSGIKACANGGTVFTITNRDMSAVNTFNLGQLPGGGSPLDSVVTRLATTIALPAAGSITDAQAQALTV